MYKKPLNLRDPQFGVNEPLRNQDSPLRQCLPQMTLEFYDAFKRVPQLRNREQHFDELPSLERLRKDANLIGKVAGDIGLPMAEACQDLLTRVEHLMSGEPVGPDLDADLTAQMVEYQGAAKALAAEVAELRVRQRSLKEAVNLDAAAKAQLADQLEQAELARALAEDKLAEAQAALEIQSVVARKAQTAVEGVAPGDPWPAAPPARAIRLLVHVQDLYDPAARDLLSSEVGEVAPRAARRWRQRLPHGGTVQLTEAGQAVALIEGVWTYLGSLDDD